MKLLCFINLSPLVFLPYLGVFHSCNCSLSVVARFNKFDADCLQAERLVQCPVFHPKPCLVHFLDANFLPDGPWRVITGPCPLLPVDVAPIEVSGAGIIRKEKFPNAFHPCPSAHAGGYRTGEFHRKARKGFIAVDNGRLRNIEEIRAVIGADSLAYLRTERLEEMAGGLGICKGCFTGKYPIDPPQEDIRGEFDR